VYHARPYGMQPVLAGRMRMINCVCCRPQNCMHATCQICYCYSHNQHVNVACNSVTSSTWGPAGQQQHPRPKMCMHATNVTLTHNMFL
jgi:hypothetical protein